MGWLVHSVPRWPQPPAPGQLVLPPLEAPQLKLSQSFLFVTLPRAQLPIVFGQLQHMQVWGGACPAVEAALAERGNCVG